MPRTFHLRFLCFTVVVVFFLFWNFHGHYHPSWHRYNKPPNDHPLTVSTTFVLRAGIHYEADYNISNLVQPKPRAAQSKVNDVVHYFPCEPPTCILLSHFPRICYLPHFLTDQECDDIIHQAASSRMLRSAVFGNRDTRTSTQAWLAPSRTVSEVRRRLMDLTGCKCVEGLQALHYSVGQKFEAHLDGGIRAITSFLYLNTVEKGGETWFPRANKGPEPPDAVSCDRGLRVRPFKGSATIFYDMTWDGGFDPYSLHGGCPVKQGEKWGGTQWLQLPIST